MFRWISASIVIISLLVPGLVVGEEEEQTLPYVLRDGVRQLDWEKSIMCMEDPDGNPVRVQCYDNADGGPLCLVTLNRRTNIDESLRHTATCAYYSGSERYVALMVAGYRMIKDNVIAEAPPGWKRDEKGRVFQVTFDLLDRYYLGVGWLPTFTKDKVELGRMRMDMGFQASYLNPRSRTRHNFKVVEGTVSIDDLQVEGLLFGYDMSQTSNTPLLRVTTFFGDPARHDLYMDVAWGMRLMKIEVNPHRAKMIQMEYGEIHLTWDIWQSGDLYNHIQLKLGAILGQKIFDEADKDDPVFVAPNAMIEARFGLGDSGLHYLYGDVHWQMPFNIYGSDAGRYNTRVGAKLAYEAIFIALNDQPLSLLLEAGLDYRNDLGPDVPDLDMYATAGFRFSFWAPARIEGPDVRGQR